MPSLIIQAQEGMLGNATLKGKRFSRYGYACMDLLRLFYGPGRLYAGDLLASAGDTDEPFLWLGFSEKLLSIRRLNETGSARFRPLFAKLTEDQTERTRGANLANDADGKGESETWRDTIHQFLEFQKTLQEAANTQDETFFDVDWAFTQPILPNDDEKHRGRKLKRCLYDALSYLTVKRFPWGALTGIRPQYIAAEYLAQGRTDHEAAAALHSDYRVSGEKAALAVQVAHEEQVLLQHFPPHSLSVYIGVPFCPTRCSYCSFSTPEGIAPSDNMLEAYTEALCRQMRAVLTSLNPIIATVYIGGGTPTCLKPEQLSAVLAEIQPFLDPRILLDYTLEAGRADTIQTAHLEAAYKTGVNRVCLNPQSMNPATLRRVNRPDDIESVFAAFASLRTMGFHAVNMDLIAGLEEKSVEDFRAGLAKVVALRPENITIHSLAAKRGAELSQTLHERLGKPDQAVAGMLAYSVDELLSRGYRPYYLYRQKDGVGGLENIGFSLPDCACYYNVGMMGDAQSIVAFGAGAMNKQVDGNRVKRLRNVKSIQEYLRRGDEIVARQLAFFERK